ncbi:hypothetical protein E2C01_030511 [Portunus trituberculatus]|uniref:Uncharacterized protein n=1 Tax=Portunus trituberculatus TaxID=210409 RepID=A0A5B7EVF6_PORTR|nr:hypothetical protein [Portunus trituberculatus]
MEETREGWTGEGKGKSGIVGRATRGRSRCCPGSPLLLLLLLLETEGSRSSKADQRTFNCNQSIDQLLCMQISSSSSSGDCKMLYLRLTRQHESVFSLIYLARKSSPSFLFDVNETRITLSKTCLSFGSVHRPLFHSPGPSFG